MPSQKNPAESVAAIALTIGGLTASFGLASCCALPILLGTAGLGTAAWLSGLGAAAIPHRTALLFIASVCLVAAAVLLIRQRNAVCEPGSICSRPAARGLTAAGLLAGVVLLYLGYTYV